MKSTQPKVLHPIGQQPMISHVLRAGVSLSPEHVIVVLAPAMEAVEKAVRATSPAARIAIQHEQLGTGHAVKCALPALEHFNGDVLVMYGDTPLIRPESLYALLAEKQAHGATIALLAMQPENPTGYGRVVMQTPPYVTRITEEKDASAEEKNIRTVWGGVMAFDAAFLREALPTVPPSAATGEFYLTTLLEIAHARGLKSIMALMPVEDAMGVNDRVQLSQAEAVFQARMREKMMLSGVTLTAPETVFFAADTQVGRDTIIRPNVVFGPDVVVGEGCVIGPFAHIRPGTRLAAEVHIGNFVELKATQAEAGAKINHLSYVGDARVGAGANVGAGTITCNYDGFAKHRTEIGTGAFIGSNSSLVAPVSVGAGAIIGAGSVVTSNVPDDALYIERSAPVMKDGAAKRAREKKTKPQ